MSGELKKELTVKYGRDADLEADANRWLVKGLRANDRGPARDAEKMAFEAGLISEDELRHYEPAADWKTVDSAFTIGMEFADIEGVEPTICVGVDDGNVRFGNPTMVRRRKLMRHIDDVDSWGSADAVPVPALGVNEGEHKACVRCGRTKRIEFFSPDPRNSDGRHSWCKLCRRDFTSQSRKGNARK